MSLIGHSYSYPSGTQIPVFGEVLSEQITYPSGHSPPALGRVTVAKLYFDLVPQMYLPNGLT
jgi:hypothetical protein